MTNRILDDTLKPQAVSDLLPQAASFGRWAVPALQSELDARKSSDTPQGRHRIYRRQSNVLLVMSHLGQTDKLWEMLHFDPTIPGDPTRRSYVIARYADSGGDPNPLLAQLDKEKNASIRQALLLMLGDFKQEQLPADNFASKVVGIFRDDPDSGVHSAVKWVLNQWKNGRRLGPQQSEAWQDAVQDLATGEERDDRQWFLTQPIAGPENSDTEPTPPLTMVILDAKQFTMGSPITELGRSSDETQHTRNIYRTFAIATTEVTNAQFRRALLDEKFSKSLELGADDLEEFPDDDRPAAGVSWYMAAAYCNWLSDQAGLEKCYEPIAEGDEKDKFAAGMRIKQDFLALSGYRLPTEAEWEYACRAGAETAYGFGDAEELLPFYAWYDVNSQEQSHPVASKRPNGFGLFDMHGNLWEWCNTLYSDYPEKKGDDTETGGAVDDDRRVLRGGSFDDDASRVRGASRNNNNARNRNHNNGFRVASTWRRDSVARLARIRGPNRKRNSRGACLSV